MRILTQKYHFVGILLTLITPARNGLLGQFLLLSPRLSYGRSKRAIGPKIEAFVTLFVSPFLNGP